ncbi:ABC transporter ATP-binding protein [Microbacteriaceae bacterium K1510]|nr:ABC transporter ATP-binding protein [Microbacteriaceae bacterium K1510]
MLELRNISAGYRGEVVLRDVQLTVKAGEIVTLIGANGAGKSTLVKAVSGLLPLMKGEIHLDGSPIGPLSPAERLRLGISHVPEGRQVFSGMTALENLRMGAYAHRGTLSDADMKGRLDEVCAVFPVLGARLNDLAGNFSGGQQQMLAIARGMMTRPRILLLDEPSLGLSPLLVSEIFELVSKLKTQGIAVLLSEQNARSALAIADRAYVIESGAVAAEGLASELRNSPVVAERYLGVGGATSFSEKNSRIMAARLQELMPGPAGQH